MLPRAVFLAASVLAAAAALGPYNVTTCDLSDTEMFVAPWNGTAGVIAALFSPTCFTLAETGQPIPLDVGVLPGDCSTAPYWTCIPVDGAPTCISNGNRNVGYLRVSSGPYTGRCLGISIIRNPLPVPQPVYVLPCDTSNFATLAASGTRNSLGFGPLQPLLGCVKDFTPAV